MGQVTIPSSGGITVIPTDRESGPGAGGGASGNRSLFLGALAGQNAAASDVIALGNNALKGGLTDTKANGMIAIGSSAAPVVTTTGGLASAEYDLPSTVVGFNAAKTAVSLASQVLIGYNAMANFVGDITAVGTPYGNVMVGDNVMALLQPVPNLQTMPHDLVLIGHRAAYGSGGIKASLQSSVIIGSKAAAGCGSPLDGAGISTTTIIGGGAGVGLGSNGTTQQSVLIGDIAGPTMTNSVNNVLIGYATDCAASTTGNTMLGAGAGGNSAANDNVCIGLNARTRGARNILLGSGALNTDVPAFSDDVFCVETVVGGTTRSLMFGNLNTGQLILGKSTQGTDRDLVGTNSVKIVNGTRGAGNPVGGGFFYVSAGALHWVGSAGTDTTVAPA